MLNLLLVWQCVQVSCVDVNVISVLSKTIIVKKKIYVVCSKSIQIGIVVVVHWVGCICNQS